MKFSRKMILIPASGREEPENEKMSDLDLEMSAIVKNPKLSNKEKVEMYNEVLRRNLIFESQLSLKGNNTPNEIVTHIEKPDESLISNVSPFKKYEYEQLQTRKFIPTENYRFRPKPCRYVHCDQISRRKSRPIFSEN